jgi:hypothetical protein
MGRRFGRLPDDARARRRLRFELRVSLDLPALTGSYVSQSLNYQTGVTNVFQGPAVGGDCTPARVPFP